MFRNRGCLPLSMFSGLRWTEASSCPLSHVYGKPGEKFALMECIATQGTDGTCSSYSSSLFICVQITLFVSFRSVRRYLQICCYCMSHECDVWCRVFASRSTYACSEKECVCVIWLCIKAIVNALYFLSAYLLSSFIVF